MAAAQVVHPLFQELHRIIVGLALHVLGQRHRHRAGLGRIGEHPHGVDHGGHQLLGTADPVPVAAHRLEGVAGGDVAVVGQFHLLQHRIRLPAGVRVAGQEQHRQPVHRGGAGGGDHVQRAGTDGTGDRHHGAPVVLLGEADGGMPSALFGLGLVEGQAVAAGGQGLAQADHDPVPEDAEHPGDELGDLAVHVEVLLIKELHQGLGHGQAHRLHACNLLTAASGGPRSWRRDPGPRCALA
jgi:hypothetical protein